MCSITLRGMARTPASPHDPPPTARPDPFRLSPAASEFLGEYHLGTLTTLRRDGTPHVVAVGFTWDAERGLARVITNGTSQKVRNVDRSGYASLCQVDRARWLTLEGPARVLRDADSVADAVARYAARYRTPRVNPARVVLEVAVARMMGSAAVRE